MTMLRNRFKPRILEENKHRFIFTTQDGKYLFAYLLGWLCAILIFAFFTWR